VAIAVEAAMSNDLVVSPLAAALAAPEPAGQKAATGGQVAQLRPAASGSPQPNPSLLLDPALGLVVIEFRDDAGAVTTSIPSERQLQEYQRWQTTHFGPAPSGMPVAGSQAPPVTKVKHSAK